MPSDREIAFRADGAVIVDGSQSDMVWRYEGNQFVVTSPPWTDRVAVGDYLADAMSSVRDWLDYCDKKGK